MLQQPTPSEGPQQSSGVPGDFFRERRNGGRGLAESVACLRALRVGTRLIDRDVVELAGSCPHPLVREEILYHTVRQMRAAGAVSAADELLVREGFALPAAAWHAGREEWEPARAILLAAVTGPAGRCVGAPRSSLLSYLAGVEAKSGRPGASVDALVEAGSLRLAHDKALEYALADRLPLTSKLRDVDYPHSMGGAWLDASRPDAERDERARRRAELLSKYRALPSYTLAGLPAARRESESGQDDARLSAIAARGAEAAAKESLLIEYTRSTGAWEAAADFSQDLGRRALQSGQREAAALIFAQSHYGLDAAIGLAMTPKNRSLLRAVAERTLTLADCFLPYPPSNAVSWNEHFGVVLESGTHAINAALATAGNDGSAAPNLSTSEGFWDASRSFLRAWDRGWRFLSESLTKAGEHRLAAEVEARRLCQ